MWFLVTPLCEMKSVDIMQNYIKRGTKGQGEGLPKCTPCKRTLKSEQMVNLVF